MQVDVLHRTPATWAVCKHCENGGETDNRKKKHVGNHIWCPLRNRVVAHALPVHPYSDEFLQVAGPLLDLGYRVPMVGRIQNPDVYQRFEDAVAEDGRLPWDCETRSPMYHVTRSRSYNDLITNGLDSRLSLGGHFGRGIYVTPDPAKANQYRDPMHSRHLMLQTRVRLGRVKTFAPGTHDPSLVREPYGFDSSKGNISGHDEYTVYDNRRVLIEYMIWYLS